MRILITGIAGTGKTTIIGKLREHGRNALDLDDCDVCAWVNKETSEQTHYKEGAGKDWIDSHRWQVITPKLIELLDSFPENEDVFVGGKIARTQAEEVATVFDKIYLLQPHDSVVDDRLATRTSNPVNFGKKKDERDYILKYRQGFENALLDVGAIPIENHDSIEDLIEKITK